MVIAKSVTWILWSYIILTLPLALVWSPPPFPDLELKRLKSSVDLQSWWLFSVIWCYIVHTNTKPCTHNRKMCLFVCLFTLLQAKASGNDSWKKEVKCFCYQRHSVRASYGSVILSESDVLVCLVSCQSNWHSEGIRQIVWRQSCTVCRQLIKKMDVWLSVIEVLSELIVSGLDDDN